MHPTGALLYLHSGTHVSVDTCTDSHETHSALKISYNEFHPNYTINIYSGGTDGIVILCGCETWSRTLLEEVSVFEKRVLREIFGSNRDEVKWEWRKLHNEEFNYLYCSPNTVRVIKSGMRLAGIVARMGKIEVDTEFCWVDLMERDHW